MSEATPSGMQVERVLEDLIARLSRTEPSKEVRAALIEARRLRSVTLTWTAIPPQSDARREMLTKAMGLVARVGIGAAPRSSAEVRAEQHATYAPPGSSSGGSGEPSPRRATTPPPPSMTRNPPGSRTQSTPPPPPPEDMSTDSRRRARGDSDLPPPSLHFPPLNIPHIPHIEHGRSEEQALEAVTPSASPVRPGAAPPPAPQVRRASPIPFRRSPSAVDQSAVRGATSIKAVGHESAMRNGSSGEKPRRAFGSGQATQTSMSRPLRTSLNSGVSLVRPQATAWQAYPRVAGAKLKMLWRDADSGAYTALLHLAPGTTLPARRHAAVEEMLLIEGAAYVGTYEMRSGEYCRAEAGSVHDPIRSEDGCTFFVTGSERDELVEPEGSGH